jgi:tRNA (cmo5U34)-methyltransferase
MQREDLVWQCASLVRTFVEDVRGGVPYATDQIEMMLRVIAARPEPVRCFADLGCGSGVLARAVLAQYPEAHAALIDFSEPMLAEARRVLAGHVPQPHIIAADLASPHWSAGIAELVPLDAVVSGYAIHHLQHERKRLLYGEIFDVLAPGGLFVNVEHVASSTPWVETRSDELMIDTMCAFHQRRGTGKTRDQVRDAFVHRPDKAANILAPVETQCEWLREIGFANVDCYFKVFELAVFGGQRPA